MQVVVFIFLMLSVFVQACAPFALLLSGRAEGEAFVYLGPLYYVLTSSFLIIFLVLLAKGCKSDAGKIKLEDTDRTQTGQTEAPGRIRQGVSGESPPHGKE